MKKGSTVLGLLGLLLFVSPVFGESSCLICHNAMSGTAVTAGGEQVNLSVSSEEFAKSVHGGMACTDCHQSFSENPHAKPGEGVSADLKGLSEKISSKAKKDPIAYSSCLTCHSEEYAQVLGSVHGKNIIEKKAGDGALCLDCHGGPHGIVKGEESLTSRKHVVETCGKCHGNEALSKKYGHGGHVMTSYEDSFHGKKYTLGHTKVPTCVNCHGFHDIRKKDDPASPIFSTNKEKTCGNCHKGANAKFVASITHQEVGPIPHYAEKGLIVLLMATIAFCISHVVLEAFSDIRDTLFRKEEGDEHGHA